MVRNSRSILEGDLQPHLPGLAPSPDPVTPVRVQCYRESGGRFSCDLFALEGGGLVARAYGKSKGEAFKNAVKAAEG